jgi:hypothetical protein
MNIAEVIPKDDYMLYIKAEDGKTGLFDVKPYLDSEVFAPLKDRSEGLCRHFLRNLTGRPSRPQEQKLGDTLCLRRPAPSGVAPPRTLRCDGAPP